MAKHRRENRSILYLLEMAAWLLAAVVFASGLALTAVGTACPTEDSSNCVWWGPLQGNGKGNIVINIGRQ